MKTSILVLAAMAVCGVNAAPIKIIPPGNGRFLMDQKFDLRFEVGQPISSPVKSMEVTVDGGSVSVSGPDAFAGFSHRAFSYSVAGVHTIKAVATLVNGAKIESSSTFEIIDPFGDKKPVRNIIILLGDGMSAQHRTAARIVRYGVKQGTPQGYLAMDKMPGTGQVITHSLNSIVTDSAPGMSCYTSGNHNQNGQEGVFPDNTADSFDNPRVEYMSEYLHRKLGKSLGLVSTADIEDATPAANVIHTANRGAGQGICDQYLDESNNSGLSVLLGGGRRWFLPSTVFGSSRSSKNDYVLPDELANAWGVPKGKIDPERDLIGDFQKSGFTYVGTNTELKSISSDTTKLLGLFGYGNMNVSMDKIAKRRNPGQNGVVDDYYAPDQPMLDDMTEAALNVLNKNEKGFVLTVEGAHIDKQSHYMDADRAIWETIEFDRAVQKCLDFADRVGDTIVIVTSDHECSGFSIIGAAGKKTADLKNLASDKALVNPSDHPARQAAVALYDAAGFPNYTIEADGFPTTADPDFKLLVGFGSNADRYEDLLSKPLPVIDGLLTQSIKDELKAKGYASSPIDRKPESDNGFFIRGQIPGDQAAHTAGDIPVSAYGVGWMKFVGVQDNTDIFFKLVQLAFGG